MSPIAFRISDLEFRIKQSAIRNSRSAIGAALLVLAGVPASATPAYDAVIAPIFRARCVECHGAEKQKAKLALHSWELAAKGSDAGPIWVAGKPSDSTLVQRLRLPLDDEEHMPPKDHPQPAPAEIALIAHWIERGASHTATVEQLQLPAALATAAAELPAKLAALPAPKTHEVWEFDPAAVKQARAPLAGKVKELQRKFPGALTYASRASAELQFTAVGFGPAFGDAELAALAPLREQLVFLDVSGSAVTDRSAPVIGGLSQLRVLRAASTALSDTSVAALSSLERLESLSLHGSGVTAASVAPLQKLPALRKLYVGGTEAARAAREASLPVIEAAIDFPPASPEPKTESR